MYGGDSSDDEAEDSPSEYNRRNTSSKIASIPLPTQFSDASSFSQALSVKGRALGSSSKKKGLLSKLFSRASDPNRKENKSLFLYRLSQKARKSSRNRSNQLFQSSSARNPEVGSRSLSSLRSPQQQISCVPRAYSNPCSSPYVNPICFVTSWL